MKFSPDLFKTVDHCQHRSFITNKYTGARIAVDCGQCDYCIHKRAQKASMRVKTAASAFKHSFFVTLTFDNEHLPLMCCKVLRSDYDDVVGISGDNHFGYEHHQYIPVSEYQCDDNSALRHIFFEQVQGTVPFDREIKEYVPVKDNWFLSMDAIRSFICKTQSVDNSAYPAAEKYGLDNLIPFLNYVDVQNYIKRLRKHLFKKLGSYETLHFYVVGEYGPVHFRPHFHLVLCTNSDEVAKVLRYCHDKSWNLGRSDFQRAAGGASSYVASYVNSLCSAPLLYRSCRAFRPRSRASIGFLKRVAISWKTKTLMRKLSERSILSLTEESITSMVLVFGQLHPCRISVPYSPDSRLLAMTIVLRLLEFFELYTRRQQELQGSDSSTINKTQS